MNAKASCSDALAATSASSSSSQPAIPSPPSTIAPLSHEPLPNHHHHHHHARSASVPTGQHQLQPSHFQQIEPHVQSTVVAHLPHRPDINPVHPNKMEDQSMHISGNYTSSMDHFDQQSYGSHYNSTGVIHPAINNQPNIEYNDPNYYNSFYPNYDDQMRPYSASSNSCSSSNSDGDSQMASHHHSMHHNNNQDHSQHHNRHSMHHQSNQLVTTTTQNSGSHLDAANLSPEYVDCMDQRAHHAFEVNCFGGIGNVGIHHLSDDIHSNYMQNNHSTGVNSANAILLNGNASSGGSVLFNGNNVPGNQGISDSIQYTSVIVDSTNYHMANDQYVH